MASIIIGNKDNNLTLADVIKTSKDLTARSMIEILNLKNEILQDAPAIACNDGTTHRTTIRDELPIPGWTMINQGSPIVKSAMRQITEHTGELAAWNQVDERLLAISQKRNEVLLIESTAVMEGMAQAATEALFYGDYNVSHAEFTGFTPRYNTLSTTDPIARNVIDAGGTGTHLTSIWLIQWDSSACHLLYPAGTSAGVKMKKYEGQILTDDAGDMFPGVRVHFSWNLGLAVRDWRRVVRIANVDISKLETLVADGTDLTTTKDHRLLRTMYKAIDLLPDKNNGRTMFYMCREPHTMFNILAADRHNVALTFDSPQGEPPIMRFNGIPIRRVDGLHRNETRVI